jgi:hypothetical protein
LAAVIEGAAEDYVVAEGLYDAMDGSEGEVMVGPVEGDDDAPLEGEVPDAVYVDGELDAGAEVDSEILAPGQDRELAPIEDTSASDAQRATSNVGSLLPSSNPETDTSTAEVEEFKVSYDTPAGTGFEALAIPVDRPDAVVDAAGSRPSPLAAGVVVGIGASSEERAGESVPYLDMMFSSSY